jgi:hypothetical protein
VRRFRASAVAAGSNANSAQGPSKNTSKLDAETEELHRARPLAARLGAARRCAARAVSPSRAALTPTLAARADEKVSSELKTNIMKARLEKKMTQAQLAQVRPR